MRQVVVTIETSGAYVEEGHRIIEVACIELINKKLTGKHFHQYINPQRDIDEFVFEHHGITNEFLEDKPTFYQIADDFLSFISSDEIITYNEPLVFGFISLELSLLNKKTPISNKIIDTLKIGNEKHPKQNNGLYHLCHRYYVDTSQSGLDGALFTAELIGELYLALNDTEKNKITSDLSKYKESKNLVVVNDISELDEAIDGISKSALCRGVSNHEYPLLPSLFRHTDTKNIDLRESHLMWVFKAQAKPHLEKAPQSEIEWLTIAQHHGLPTRLLDWSLSPLVACFFAVQNLSSSDAAIFIYDIGKFRKEEEIHISKINKITAFFPSHATKRVTAQSGMFTLHPTSEMKLESSDIKKILIPAEKKKLFLEKLIKYGIHQSTMFPDLDGLSSYIKYLNGYR